MKDHSSTDARFRVLLSIVVVGFVAALVIVPIQFRTEAGNNPAKRGLINRTESHVPGLENYDIRTTKSLEASESLTKFRDDSGKSAADIADTVDGFVRGEETLRETIKTLKVEYNPSTRTPEVITPDVYKANIERLTGASRAKNSATLKNFARSNNDLVGMDDDQIDQLKLVADYTNPSGSMAFAQFNQEINGVPVFGGEIKAGFTTRGEMVRVINNLAADVDYGSLSVDFGNPDEAVRSAYRYLNSEPGKLDTQVDSAASTDLKTVYAGGDNATTAEKMYFPVEPGVVRPAWRVLVIQPVSGFYVVVDAETGAMLWRKNISNDQTQTATYEVYSNSNGYIDAADSPAPLSPGPVDPTTGQQGAIIPMRTLKTLIGNEAPNNGMNDLGWMTDGTNFTDGNNVEAGLDITGGDGVDAPMPGDGPCPGAGCRIFTSTWNPPPGNPAPGDAPTVAAAQRGAVIQMFYVMNLYHDVLYNLGWTEPAFNFQTNNFGRGGTGNDRVRAEGQDSSGTNNANMLTPADGGRGRMQMYVWNGPTPDYDGTADADVIIHEITHGLSNRLHGNTVGLGTNMSGGMGEGWGDWYAHTMLAEATDPINGVYSLGGYATYLAAAGYTANYYSGIRKWPKAPIAFTGGPGNLPHNPLTFRYLNAGCATLIGTTTSAVNSAYPRGPFGSATCDQVHNAGEVWSSALWEVRNLMVTRLGFGPGTKRVLQVVTDGMKLAPLNPTFLQERDAIIAAASALPVAPNASADVADVREGFRRRGMGFSASIQSVSPAAVTEAFDFPNVQHVDPFSVSDSTGDNDGFPEPGENVLLSVAVTNTTGGSVTNVMVDVDGGTPVSYGTINDTQTVTMQIPYTIPGGAACGAFHNVNVNVTSDAGAQTPVARSFRLGAPVGGAPATFENTTAIDIPTGQPATTIGPANPYPSTIAVSGLTGNKVIEVEFTSLNHTWVGDVDAMLESPSGQKMVIASDMFNSSNRTGTVVTTLKLRDSAAENMPASGVPPVAGTYKPTNHGATDPFDAPAPSGPYENPAPAGTATFQSAYGMDGAAMNGDWKLWIDDDASGDPGTMAGWKITFESDNYECSLAPQSPRADFDGDGKTDVSVFRPSEGNWYSNGTTSGFAVTQWGISSDTIVPGDYDGDGKADTVVFRVNADPSQPDYYVLASNGFVVSGVSLGLSGDIPVSGDFSGDGKTDFAVFRPGTGTWYVFDKATSSGSQAQFGQSGDIPFAIDNDGDGKANFAVYRPGTNTFYIARPTGVPAVNFDAFQYGLAGDLIAPADYNGDGKEDIAMFRPSTGVWYVRDSNTGSTSQTQFGTSGDRPVPGDYDGDGKYDIAIYRAGQWWINRSSGGVSVFNFGLGTDKPVPGGYIP